MIIDKRTATLCLLLSSTLLLAACDLPFLSDEDAKIEARRQAEGMAIGSGCRYSSRSLEECYGMNPKTSKAAILNGWRDMDGYMRDNNIVVAGPDGNAAKQTDGGAAEAKPQAEAQPAPEAPKAADATTPAGPKRTRATQEMASPRSLKHMI